MNRILLVILLVLLLPVTAVACEGSIIKVRNQQEFDALQENLTQLIKTGEKDIKVVIYSGTYVVKEQHLTLKDVKAPDTRISIKGKNATIIPDGSTYRNGDTYQGTFSPDHSWMNGNQDVNIWSGVRYADGLIEILNEENKTCRLKSKEPLPSVIDIKNVYILIPHWFKSSVYKVDKIENGWFFFTAKDLSKGYRKGFSVNDDFNYGKKGVRYKICNIEDDAFAIKQGKVFLSKNLFEIKESKICRMITITMCQLKSFEMCGLNIQGNSNNRNDYVISFRNNSCNDIVISRCSFTGIHSNVIYINASNNVQILDNLFEDCYLNGIYADNKSKKVVVKDNTFSRMGKRMLNTFCITCQGADYHIVGNTLTDYGYGGIAVGVWYNNFKENPSNGIVENNTLVYSSEYISAIPEYGLMDGGAIYLFTKNDNVIIRNNFIRGYVGLCNNRGIYCDDGAFNYQIYSNVIIDIVNGYCIDSRLVPNVAKRYMPESEIDKPNVNNIIYGNFIDGKIRFEGHSGKNNGCVKGANYYLLEKGKRREKSIYNNVFDFEDDVVVLYERSRSNNFFSALKKNKLLIKSPVWIIFKRHFDI